MKVPQTTPDMIRLVLSRMGLKSYQDEMIREVDGGPQVQATNSEVERMEEVSASLIRFMEGCGGQLAGIEISGIQVYTRI